jgi:hypothetical protein
MKPLRLSEEVTTPVVLRAHRQSTMVEEPPQEVITEDIPRRRFFFARLLHVHTLQVLSGMMLALVLYLFITSVALPTVNETAAHWNYGQARLSQYDFNVGHGGTSHFLAQYWNHELLIIEIPHNDISHAKVYSASMTLLNDETQEARVVTLQTAYLRPNAAQGYPDLEASVSGFSLPIVFYNTGDSFVLHGEGA